MNNLKKLLGIKHFVSSKIALVSFGLRMLFLGDGEKTSIIGLCEVFYIAGLVALTVGVAQISETAGWIMCGSILLATSVYSYVGK